MILDYIDEPVRTCNEYDRLLDIFSHYGQFILYHGTTDLFKDDILKNGIKCRNLTGISVYEGLDFGGNDLESNPDFVYVGSIHMAKFLGVKAPNKFGGDLILFKMLLELKDLFPDEDTKKETALESLAADGSAAIEKIIPADKIIGYSEKVKYVGDNSKYEFVTLKEVKSDLYFDESFIKNNVYEFSYFS